MCCDLYNEYFKIFNSNEIIVCTSNDFKKGSFDSVFCKFKWSYKFKFNSQLNIAVFVNFSYWMEADADAVEKHLTTVEGRALKSYLKKCKNLSTLIDTKRDIINCRFDKKLTISKFDINAN